MLGALLVAVFVSVKLFLSTSSKDQHTLRFQHTTVDSATDSLGSGSTAAGSISSEGSVRDVVTSQTGSHRTRSAAAMANDRPCEPVILQQ